jgi:hypothetical protein
MIGGARQVFDNIGGIRFVPVALIGSRIRWEEEARRLVEGTESTPARSSPRLPPLPLDVLLAIAETDRKIKRLLEDCPSSSLPFLLESELEKATEVMRVGVPEEFETRVEYYASQSDFCRAWLDEAAEETVRATLDLVPPR